jgi:glucosylceramidase
MVRRRIVAALLGLGLVACAKAADTPPAGNPGNDVAVWLTDASKRMEAQGGLAFGNAGSSNVITVDEAQRFQTIEGFGASFTDSAAYLLNQVATASARESAMRDLFTREGRGIGVSFVRNPMGASDLARFVYSYDDGAADPGLTRFSIAHDEADIVPLVKQARALNPDLKIMASPWSPPGWMKDSGSMIGGSLLPAMYDPFARYFVKYIQAYAAHGIPIDYVSLQNEPFYVPGDYPGMFMDAATQATVIRVHLLPAFASRGITTKVLVWDHNWDRPDYPEEVFASPSLLADDQVAGVAWHGYGGAPEAMARVHDKFPTKGQYETELSGGTWVANQVQADFTTIIRSMRSWSRSFVKWSLALDENRGPHSGGCGTCSPLVTVNTGSGAVSYTTDFYTLGHFSKFVRSGAVRIHSTEAGSLVTAAFLNPDGGKALVVFNNSGVSTPFGVQAAGRAFTYTLSGLAGATFTWR